MQMNLVLDEGAMAELARAPRKYVRGTFVHGQSRLPQVGIRFKGHRTLRSWKGKPSFKVNFGRYEKGRRFLGQQEIILDNMVEDPTMLREALGFWIAREAGLAAPRTGWVQLQVNGEPFGLYTLVEAVGKPLLRRHFDDDSGPLYEGEYGCDVYPGDVWGMELDDGDDPDRALLRALATAAEGPIGPLLRGDQALLHERNLMNFLAVSTLIGDFDGYRHAHNYRLYFDRKDGRWSLLPWGLDRVLKKRLDIYDSHGRLAAKCFADPGCRLEYVKSLRAAADRLESLAPLQRMAALEGTIADAARADPRRPHDGEERERQLKKTRRFLRERAAEVRAETACWDGAREVDRDGDGVGCGDCNDADPKVFPGAAETCDGIDNDCSGLADDGPDCPCPTLELEGAQFALCNRPRTWPQAAEQCAAMSATLARLDSKAQARGVYRAAKRISDDIWWIGLNDRAQEGQLAWHDKEPVTFTYFASGEPDHYACGQDCNGLKKGGGGHFRDLHCGSLRPFICRTR